MAVNTVVDLHCDTLTRTAPGADSLNSPGSHWSLDAVPAGTRWCQCFAVFIPDTLKGAEAEKYFDVCSASFFRQTEEVFPERMRRCTGLADIRGAWEQGKTAALLTVENGSVLNGRLDRVELLRRRGVCALTLTWNGPNELGSGHGTEGGLTSFGRDAVRELEQAGILCDISHLNDRGVEDFLDAAARPFLATHSNARSVCGHRRNLPDAVIREMVSRRCLIGLNFYECFLRDGGTGAGLEDLFLHTARFLELGAERCLALGSDFDGAEIPDCLAGPGRVLEAKEYLVSRGVSREEAERIFHGNAEDFFAENLP